MIRGLLAAVLLPLIAHAQEQAVFRVDTTVHQVDAVVTDRHDRVVSDLEARDFEIVMEKKHTRAVDYSSFVPLTGPQPASAATADGRPVAEELRRTFVFVISCPTLDVDFGDSRGASEAAMRIRAAAARGNYSAAEMLTHFVRKRMEPGDLVEVLKVDQDVGVLAQPTHDKDALFAAIAEMRARPVMQSVFVRLARPRPVLAPLMHQNLQAIRIARAAVDQLAGLPGRRTVILAAIFMLPNHPRVLEGQTVAAAMGELADCANKAGVTVHTISLAGMEGAGALHSTDNLYRVAAETGGTVTENNHDFNGVLDRIAELNRGYYLLGYRLEEGEIPGKIKVRVKRPGLRVHARSTALEAAAGKPLVATANDLRAALTSPVALRDIPVSLDAEPAGPAGKGTAARLRYALKVGLDNVEPGPVAGGQGFVLDIVIGVAGPDGQWLKLESNTHHFRLANSSGQPPRPPLAKTYEIEVDKPGYYQLRALVRDTRTNRAGTAARFITVPAADPKHRASRD